MDTSNDDDWLSLASDGSNSQYSVDTQQQQQQQQQQQASRSSFGVAAMNMDDDHILISDGSNDNNNIALGLDDLGLPSQISLPGDGAVTMSMSGPASALSPSMFASLDNNNNNNNNNNNSNSSNSNNSNNPSSQFMHEQHVGVVMDLNRNSVNSPISSHGSVRSAPSPITISPPQPDRNSTKYTVQISSSSASSASAAAGGGGGGGGKKKKVRKKKKSGKDKHRKSKSYAHGSMAMMTGHSGGGSGGNNNGNNNNNNNYRSTSPFSAYSSTSSLSMGGSMQSGNSVKSFHKVEKKKKKRDRVKTACTNCKTAKTKCDENRPCARCVKRGVQCVDVVHKLRGKSRGKKRERSRTPSGSTLRIATSGPNFGGDGAHRRSASASITYGSEGYLGDDLPMPKSPKFQRGVHSRKNASPRIFGDGGDPHSPQQPPTPTSPFVTTNTKKHHGHHQHHSQFRRRSASHSKSHSAPSRSSLLARRNRQQVMGQLTVQTQQALMAPNLMAGHQDIHSAHVSHNNYSSNGNNNNNNSNSSSSSRTQQPSFVTIPSPYPSLAPNNNGNNNDNNGNNNNNNSNNYYNNGDIEAQRPHSALPYMTSSPGAMQVTGSPGSTGSLDSDTMSINMYIHSLMQGLTQNLLSAAAAGRSSSASVNITSRLSRCAAFKGNRLCMPRDQNLPAKLHANGYSQDKMVLQTMNMAAIIHTIDPLPMHPATLLWCNKMLSDYLGYTLVELQQVLHMPGPFSRLFHVSNLPAATEKLVSTIAAGRVRHSYRSTWIHKSGKLLDTFETVMIKYVDGHALYMVSWLQPWDTHVPHDDYLAKVLRENPDKASSLMTTFIGSSLLDRISVADERYLSQQRKGQLSAQSSTSSSSSSSVPHHGTRIQLLSSPMRRESGKNATLLKDNEDNDVDDTNTYVSLARSPPASPQPLSAVLDSPMKELSLEDLPDVAKLNDETSAVGSVVDGTDGSVAPDEVIVMDSIDTSPTDFRHHMMTIDSLGDIFARGPNSASSAGDGNNNDNDNGNNNNSSSSNIMNNNNNNNNNGDNSMTRTQSEEWLGMMNTQAPPLEPHSAGVLELRFSGDNARATMLTSDDMLLSTYATTTPVQSPNTTATNNSTNN